MAPWQTWLRFSHGVMFPQQLAAGVFFLRLFGDEAASRRLDEQLRQLPAGTVGHALVAFLDAHGHRLVPGYERHDLKHVLLGYSTSPPDEMRMQAFMTGNAGFGRESLMALCFLPWTPDAWPSLPRHFLAGRYAARAGGRDVAATAPESLADLQRQLGLEEAFRRADAVLAEQWWARLLPGPHQNRHIASPPPPKPWSGPLRAW